MPEQVIFSLHAALTKFVEATQTQSQEHIRPLHWHIASRLVVEGGFRPDDITPTPPFRIERVRADGGQRWRLIYDESAARAGEQTVLGGLKTKNVDVVISTKNTGPCVAVSVKGSTNAFRNLTNRMEEAVGDCTNLHMSYPALVYGFLHVVRANMEKDVRNANDIVVFADGSISDGIKRYHDAMARLTTRLDVRDEPSRYETVALALVNTARANRGQLLEMFPPHDSPLFFEGFFPALYRTYDLRFVYAAPAMKSVTQRLEWEADSPAFTMPELVSFKPRVADAE